MSLNQERITHLASELGAHLLLLKAQVSTAESCTGGGISEAITRVSGCSAWFEAGYVTYSNQQKTRLLDVPAELLLQVGAVSREVVSAMVRGAQEASASRFAVAVSGIAGPDGGSAEKPVGTVWLAWADNEHLYCQCKLFAGDRQAVCEQTIVAALQGLIRLAVGENPDQG